MPDVIIIGAGAIGSATAWRCAQRGLSVALIDPDLSRGAWRTAAGMLAPITELHYTESALLRLNLDSLARYPSYVAELTSATGLPTGYQRVRHGRGRLGRRRPARAARPARVRRLARSGRRTC